MRFVNVISFLGAVLFFALLSGCSNTRHLTGDQMLYSGNGKLEIIVRNQAKDTRQAEKIAGELTFYKPNGAVLKSRRVLPPVGLWVFNYLKPKGEGKIGNWFYKTFSVNPILVSQVNPEQRCRKLESELFNNGYFSSKATFRIDTCRRNPRKGKIDYRLEVDNPYRISRISFADPDNPVDSMISALRDELPVKQGDLFNMEVVVAIRNKLASTLVEHGYYYFKPDYVQIVADTVSTPYLVDLLIGKSVLTPEHACRKYTLDRILVKMGVLQDGAPGLFSRDTIVHDGISLTGYTGYLKPGVLARAIQFRSGDAYSTAKDRGTIRKLNNYGVFKSVRMQFLLQDSLHQKMNLLIETAPKNNVTLNLEGFVETKSSGFAGPGVEVTLAHGNLNREANKLQLKLNGGLEWQWGNKVENDLGNNSYNVGLNSSYVFPRLVLPFKLKKEPELISTKSIISLGYEFINNIVYYRMNAVKLGWGYQWQQNPKITHVFYPFNINMVNLLKTTAEFDSIVNSNPYVKKSFEEQSIAGMKYDFSYDNMNAVSDRINLLASLGTSGNLIDLAKSISGGERPYSVLGNVYSQFIKVSADFRYHASTAKKGWVFRFYTGAGISYGNSTVMPYIEQFYSGGSNSLRGFTARSLGPGSYKPVENNGIIDQTGDIKLEGNVEYRFPFSGMVLGAFFLDAGNVWLLDEDVNRPGAEFKFSNFAKQLAVGTGFGLRFDFDFFILRTDLGLPLRNPYPGDDGYWMKPEDVFSGYRLNLAIGFPF